MPGQRDAIGAAIGKQVRYEPVTIEATWQSMVEMGMDEWSVNLLCDYYAAYSTNWGDQVTDDFQRMVGKTPRSIADFASDYADAFANH